MSEQHEHPPEPAKKVDWLAELRSLAWMLLAVLTFHSLIAKPFYIPSGSMMPTLLVGDRLVVSKFPYGWNWSSLSFHLAPRADWRIKPATPDYGDIVILVPRGQSADLIKRVVARPGDRIALSNGQIILNGKPVPQVVAPSVQLPSDDQLQCDADGGRIRYYCYAPFAPFRVRLPSGRSVYEMPTLRETLPNGVSYYIIDAVPRGEFDTMPEITVPAGHVFVMGDNRDFSADSRVPLERNGIGGPVALADIGGRAEFTTFSLNGSETLNPLTWWGALRGDRAWRNLRPTHVGSSPEPAR